ncbi:DUF2860 family protein [Photobacterium atrarenae]|uniref:DUF2860 domain-containing protein n=1 Tax=Photobacterium atrarenae TaxID=865757 RepID=A0ABY5GIC5_9GAMM|nr:DUF2860 family protein [Photobacterium atrarenae]UTV28906.1 DUF2860 domain-containing protein [Photobacterium atrarenae]
MTSLRLCLGAGLISATATAQPYPQWEPGFGGEIALMASYDERMDESTPQTPKPPPSAPRHPKDTARSPKDDNKKSKTKVIPFGMLTYTFAQGDQQLYFGTSRSDLALGRFHAELGYVRQLNDGSRVSFGYVPGLLSKEVDRDPFAGKGIKSKTDSTVEAVRLKYKQILGSALSLELAAGKQQIEDEQSGQQLDDTATQAALIREGDILFSQLSYLKPLGQNQRLRTALSYSRLDAQGDAVASHNYGAESSLVHQFQRASLALTLKYRFSDYDSIHPVYQQRRKDQRWGGFLAYEYREPFGWKRWSLVTLAGYNDTQSNIQFYDEQRLLISAGARYTL